MEVGERADHPHVVSLGDNLAHIDHQGSQGLIEPSVRCTLELLAFLDNELASVVVAPSHRFADVAGHNSDHTSSGETHTDTEELGCQEVGQVGHYGIEGEGSK